MLTIAGLNDLEVHGSDAQNTFLTSPNKEKVWLKARPEHGAESGKNLLIVRSLHGLKPASASFRACMAKKWESMGFKLSVADPDAWMRPASKSDGEEHCEHVLMCVDDMLAISADPMPIMLDIQGMVRFKNDKIEEPSNHLQARLQKKTINGIVKCKAAKCWGRNQEHPVEVTIDSTNIHGDIMHTGARRDTILGSKGHSMFSGVNQNAEMGYWARKGWPLQWGLLVIPALSLAQRRASWTNLTHVFLPDEEAKAFYAKLQRRKRAGSRSKKKKASFWSCWNLKSKAKLFLLY
jgi:hypothetical protein